MFQTRQGIQRTRIPDPRQDAQDHLAKIGCIVSYVLIACDMSRKLSLAPALRRKQAERDKLALTQRKPQLTALAGG